MNFESYYRTKIYMTNSHFLNRLRCVIKAPLWKIMGAKIYLKYDWYRHSYLEIVVRVIPIEFYFEKCMI